MTTTFPLETHDGTQLQVYRWLPDGPPTAIVQLAHGMAEHAGRYERFAKALTDVGYVVYADDHRGHGLTAAGVDAGYFADRGGWDKVVEDLSTVAQHAREEHPGLPLVLFGHSMGSFMVREYAIRHGSELAALVVCGTAGDPGMLGKVGGVVASLEGRIRGRKHPSNLMNKLTFGQYNAQFKPKRTDFDWLSRDPAEVDKYVADLQCGAVFSDGFFSDLLGGLAHLQRDDEVAKVPNDLPVLLISGDKDPVGDNGKGVRAVAAQLERAGVRDVTTTLYPGARHELLNETNRDEVTADVVSWIREHLRRD
ncbi:lysophospholipase [Leekyejoonella antrihumi]